jgi:F-type H+-transporting ATPase subunit gamma
MRTYSAYQDEIRGFEELSDTVKAEEKIAATSVHTLEVEVENLHAYMSLIGSVLRRLSLFYENYTHPLLRKHAKGSAALLVLTGDKGLVGGLWQGMVEMCLRGAGEYQAIIVSGLKGKSLLDEEGCPVAASFARDDIESMSNYVLEGFTSETFSRVDVLYPQFLSLLQQAPIVVPFLPFTFPAAPSPRAPEPAFGFPLYEPSARAMFVELLKKYIDVYLHVIILEAKLSELSARTLTMEHAHDKTDELLRALRLSLTKERRHAITQEQLESFSAHARRP